MKILNLYSGIGGNRKLWGNNHEITAVELNEEIAKVYKDLFPGDEMIVDDAHEFLLKNYMKYDFIWSSPPCPTHSRMRYTCTKQEQKTRGKLDVKYPDMTLYQEIILLDKYFEGKYVVENVVPYYEPLIPEKNWEGICFGLISILVLFNLKVKNYEATQWRYFKNKEDLIYQNTK